MLAYQALTSKKIVRLTPGLHEPQLTAVVRVKQALGCMFSCTHISDYVLNQGSFFIAALTGNLIARKKLIK